MVGERILIVDDNPLNVKLLHYMLQAKGYDVQTASDAEEALGILESFRPRIILMDILLPGMDGLELTRRLKAARATQGIVIIAVTAYAMKGDEEKALAAGCDGYVAKPVDMHALLDLLERTLHEPAAPSGNQG